MSLHDKLIRRQATGSSGKGPSRPTSSSPARPAQVARKSPKPTCEPGPVRRRDRPWALLVELPLPLWVKALAATPQGCPEPSHGRCPVARIVERPAIGTKIRPDGSLGP